MNSSPPLCCVFLHTATLAHLALSINGIVRLHYWPRLFAMQINPTLPMCLISILYQTEQNLVQYDCIQISILNSLGTFQTITEVNFYAHKINQNNEFMLWQNIKFCAVSQLCARNPLLAQDRNTGRFCKHNDKVLYSITTKNYFSKQKGTNCSRNTE
jgi:hypothetical protein